MQPADIALMTHQSESWSSHRYLASNSMIVSKNGKARLATTLALIPCTANLCTVSSTPLSVDCVRRTRPVRSRCFGTSEIKRSITCLPVAPPAHERSSQELPSVGSVGKYGALKKTASNHAFSLKAVN